MLFYSLHIIPETRTNLLNKIRLCLWHSLCLRNWRNRSLSKQTTCSRFNVIDCTSYEVIHEEIVRFRRDRLSTYWITFPYWSYLRPLEEIAPTYAGWPV